MHNKYSKQQLSNQDYTSSKHPEDKVKKGEQPEEPVVNTMNKHANKFWLTIIVLFIVVLFMMAIAWYKNRDILIQDENRTPIIETFILKKQIDKKRGEISESLKSKQQLIEQEISRKVDALFAPIYSNIDTFLDFHYSVKGEYKELTTAAFSDIGKLIQKRLLGENFSENYQQMLEELGEYFHTLEREHANDVVKITTEDINLEINPSLMDRLKKSSLYHIGATLAIVGTIKRASKLLANKLSIKLASKLTSKFGTKLLVKSGIKTGGKLTATGAAASAGLSCGPLAPICSSALALAAWFGTDAIISTADEMLNRDDFKKELIRNIDNMKTEIKLKLQDHFIDELASFSNVILEEFGKIKVKRTVKEMIEYK